MRRIVLTVLAGMTLTASAAYADTDQLLVCVQRNGDVRLLLPGRSCRHDESLLRLNVRGPQGPKGDVGPQGPKGRRSHKASLARRARSDHKVHRAFPGLPELAPTSPTFRFRSSSTRTGLKSAWPPIRSTAA